MLILVQSFLSQKIANDPTSFTCFFSRFSNALWPELFGFRVGREICDGVEISVCEFGVRFQKTRVAKRCWLGKLAVRETNSCHMVVTCGCKNRFGEIGVALEVATCETDGAFEYSLSKNCSFFESGARKVGFVDKGCPDEVYICRKSGFDEMGAFVEFGV